MKAHGWRWLLCLMPVFIMLGCTNIPAKIQQLESQYSEDRADAVLWLGDNFKVKVTTKMLITVLVGIPEEELPRDPSPFVRSVAARVMGKDGKMLFLPFLLKALKDDESYLVRYEVVESLKSYKAPDTEPTLIKTMEEDTHPWVRFKAIQALASLKSEKAIPHLIQAMGDEDPSVQLNAYLALKEISGKDFEQEKEPWERWIISQQKKAQN